MVQSFSNNELRENLAFYRGEKKKGREVTLDMVEKRLGCSRARAEMILSAVKWAYNVQEKERQQYASKRIA